MKPKRAHILGILASVLVLSSASCGGRSTVFLNQEFNFQFVERVAIIPMDNLTSDKGAGARATRVFLSELLSTEAFDVVEPGEVTLALAEQSTLRTSELTTEQIVALGKRLKVQGLFFGSVTESSTSRSTGSASHIVSMVVRLVETETGQTVWSATNSSGGRGFWASLFGGGGKSQSEVTQECVRKIIATLVK